MAEMLLAVVLLGRRVVEDSRGCEPSNPVRLNAMQCFWKLPSAFVTYFLALVLAVQVAGHANRLMYRRLTALETEAAKAKVGSLVMSTRDMVVSTSWKWNGS